MEPITLDQAFVAPMNTVSLDTTDAPSIPSNEIAQTRAAKAEFGLGANFNDAFGDIASGNEQAFREKNAASKDVQKLQAHQQLVIDTLKKVPDAAVLAKDKIKLAALLGQPAPTDPNSVIEEYYSGQYLKPMYNISDQFNQGTFMEDAHRQDPQGTQEELDHGASIMTYREYALKKAQDAESAVKQSQSPYMAAMSMVAKAAITPVAPYLASVPGVIEGLRTPEELALRFLTGGKIIAGLGLGTAMEERAQELRDLPFPEYKKQLDDIDATLSRINPEWAQKFDTFVAGQSLTKIGEENIQTLMNVPQDFAIGFGGLIKKGYRTVANNLARRQVQTAVKDMVLSSAEVERGVPIPVSNAAAKGDLETAAVKTQASESSNPKPIEDAVNALPTAFKQDATSIRADPGNHGQEFANRIAENTEAVGVNMDQAKRNLMEVNRTSVIETSEDAVRMVKEEVKNKYAGPNSTVINVGNPIHSSDLVEDVVKGAAGSNTYWVPIRIGDHDGLLFKTENQAIEHAEAQGIGMHEPRTTNRAYLNDRAQELKFKIHETEQHLEPLDPQHGDTNELNRWNNLNDQLTQMRQDLKDMMKVRAAAFWKPDFERPAVDGAMLKQWGAGWYLERYVPVPEYGTLRQNLIKLNPDAHTPLAGKTTSAFQRRMGAQTLQDIENGGKVSAWSKWTTFLDNPGRQKALGLRSPAETMSKVDRAQRAVAVHTAHKIMDIIKNNDKAIRKVPHEYTNRFRETLKSNQTMMDPDNPDPNLRGYFFKSPGELDRYYMQHWQDLPSKAETEAYFAFKNNIEFDRGLRTWNLLRNKWINGVEEHTLSYRGANGKMVKSSGIEGTLQKVVPKGHDATIFVNWGDGERKSLINSQRMDTKRYKELQNMVDTGEMQVIKVWNSEDRDWHGFIREAHSPGTKVQYVITRGVETRNLDPVKQIPRRGGGHWIFEYPVYGKQAKVMHDDVTGLHHYEGDTTAMAFATDRTARRWVDHMNQIREYLRNNDEQGARSFHNGNFGQDFDNHILPQFKESKGPNGETLPAQFSTTEPFVAVPKGEMIANLDKSLTKRYESIVDGKRISTFRDGTRSGNPARQATVEFTGERDAYDLHTIQDKGTPSNPVYMYKPADLMSPIDAMNRATTRLVNSTVMDDLKTQAVTHWIQSASHWLEEKDGLLENAPFRYFMEPSFKTGTPPAVERALMANRAKTEMFIGGTRNMIESALQSTAEAANSILYGAGAGKVLPLDRIIKAENPVQALRSLVVHAKLGWISQFFTQMFTAANVHMLEPKYTLRATGASLMHEYMRAISADHIGAMSRVMEKSGFKPGQFEEAWRGLNDRSGFFDVGSEHAIVNTQLQDQPISNLRQGIGKAMLTPFREGAQYVRAAAWYTSYLKYRDLNPTGAISRTGWEDILLHATDLDHNMSRAYNSSINTGAASFVTMFATYSRNLAEMFYGKRFTVAQKTRLFAVSSALWGVPAGGIGLLGIPLEEKARQYMIDKQDYIPGYNTFTSAVMEGAPSALNAWITGGGDPHKGIYYDYSKYGVKGWDPASALLMDQDTSRSLGAVFSVVKNTLQRTRPLVYWGLSQIGEYGDVNETYPLQPSDLTDLLREFSAFSYPEKAYVATKTGNWISNNGGTLQKDVTVTDALFRAMSGLTDVNIADITPTRGILEARGDFVHRIEQMYDKEIQAALTAAKEDKDTGTNSSYQKRMSRASWLLNLPDMPVDDRMAILNRAANGDKSLLESLEEQMTTRHVPENREQEMLDRHNKVEDLNEQKAQ